MPREPRVSQGRAGDEHRVRAPQPPLTRQSWGGINTDSRRTISAGTWVNLSYYDEGKSHGSSLSPYINILVSPRLQISVGSGISRDHNNTQWLGNFTDSGTGVTHYSFAHLDQQTVSMNARINYTMTPNLTFEFYGQPFVSTGMYSNVREVSAAPRAARYDDQFRPYVPSGDADLAFKFTQLRSNSVVR